MVQTTQMKIERDDNMNMQAMMMQAKKLQREIQKLVDKDYNFLLNKVEKMIEDNNDPLFKIE